MFEIISLGFLVLSGIGGVVVWTILIKLNAQARNLMEVNDSIRQKAVRAVAKGSVWCALTFSLAIFLLLQTSLYTDIPVVGEAVLALCAGVGLGLGLAASAWMYLYWLEKLALPALCAKAFRQADKRTRE